MRTHLQRISPKMPYPDGDEGLVVLVIPDIVMRATGIKANDEVDMKFANGRLIIDLKPDRR
ncbi:MAG: hypothetical protein ACXQS4_02085 [Methermicoccaceae archaeon]